MVRRLVIIGAACLTLILSGCIYQSETRPPNQVPSEWICQEPYILITVPEGYKEDGTETLDPVCHIFVNGELLESDVLFTGGPGVYFTLDDGRQIDGDADYRWDDFTVTVNTKDDTLFNGIYEELYFVKQ